MRTRRHLLLALITGIVLYSGDTLILIFFS